MCEHDDLSNLCILPPYIVNEMNRSDFAFDTPVLTTQPADTAAADFEQRIRAQIYRSVTIAHASTFVTGVISVAGSAELRRRPRAWAALAVSAVQGTLARRAMVRGEFASRRVAGAHAVCAALNQELMPALSDGVSKRERCWVRYQAMWLSAMGRAGGSADPGAWTAVAHVPTVIRAVLGEQEAIAHVSAHAVWLTFLRHAMKDALLSAPEVLNAIDRRTADASSQAADQATRDALSSAVVPLVERMRHLRDHAADIDATERLAQCQAMLSEASEVCDRTATTAGDDPFDQDVFEAMVSDLQRRSDRTTTVSYGAVILDSLLSLFLDLRQPNVPRSRVLASAAITIGTSLPSMRKPPRFMRGELAPGSTASACVHGLAIGASALVLRGVPASTASLENFDRLTYTAAGIGCDNRSVVLPWAIAATIGLPTLARAQRPGEQVFVVAHVLGVGLGTSLALNHFFRGLGITNQAAAASRQQLVSGARDQAVRKATLWAQLAAHDYVKQTARFLMSNPDTSPDHVFEVLDDAIRQLEAGLASSFGEAPQRSDISQLVTEVAGAYRRLALDPAVVLDLADPVSAEVERAVLTAVNQGLANVLAHTGDHRPVVRVRTQSGGAEVDVTNTRRRPLNPPARSDGTGFRLLDAALAPVGGVRTLRTDDHHTVLRVRIPSERPAN